MPSRKRFGRSKSVVYWSVLGLAVSALLSVSRPAFAQLPVPTLNTLYPPGGKQGSSLEVAVAGVNLDDGQRLLFSHPGIAATAKMSAPTDFRPTPVPILDQFTVTIAADVPPGIYEARHVGRYGASNPRLFVVGALPEVIEVAGNNKPETAFELTDGSTLTGRADANAVDYFALTLKAGQHVLIDCLAQRIDSRMNATIVVVAPTGREIARSLDVEGLDPVLEFVAPADGKYTLGVYDFVYNGGPDYFYRLTVANAPHIDFVFPPSGPPGSNNAYTVYGRNLPGGQPAEGVTVGGQALQKLTVNIAIPGDEALRTQAAVVGPAPARSAFVDSVEFRLPSPQGNSNSVAIGVAQGPVIVEQEPNGAESPQVITVPCEYVGQFYPQRDQDWVQFDAKKSDIYWIEVIAHRLGRNSDPSLLIQRLTKNDKGEALYADVAQVDDAADRPARVGTDFDTSSDDPSYKLTVPDDGTYRVGVRDNFGDGRKDPRFVYRLVIRKPEPDFRVAVYPDVPNVGKQDQNQVPMDTLMVRKGGATMLRIVIDRRDEFAGEIAVYIEGLPGGVTSSGAVLGGGVNTGTLVVSANEGVAAICSPIKVVAKAAVNGQEKMRIAQAGTLVWGTTNRQQIPPTYRALRDLVLCVADKEPDQVSMTVGDGNVVETSLGGKIELPVAVARRGELKDPIKLIQIGLPNELKPKDLSINNGANDGKLELEVNNQNIKPGTYTFCLRGDSKISYARNPESAVVAEAEKKQLEDAIAAMTEKFKLATAARDLASQTAQASKTAAQQAEQAKNQAAAEVQQKQDAEKKVAEEKLAAADKMHVEAQAKVKETEDARVKAEAELKQVDDKVKQGQQLKQQFDPRYNDIKAKAQPKDVAVSFLSTPIKLRIVPSPIKLDPPTPTTPAKIGVKTEVPVNIVRMFSFNEPVEVTLEPPPGVPGLAAVKAMIPAGQTAGKAELTPQANAPVGEHIFAVKARGRFNNVNVETVGQLTVKVEPAQ